MGQLYKLDTSAWIRSRHKHVRGRSRRVVHLYIFLPLNFIIDDHPSQFGTSSPGIVDQVAFWEFLDELLSSRHSSELKIDVRLGKVSCKVGITLG